MKNWICLENSDLDEIYEGEIVEGVLRDVHDCTFIYHPHTKRVDFQVVAYNDVILTNWQEVVKIPENLPIRSSDDAYGGTVITSDGYSGICYISPSYSGYLSVTGVSQSIIGSIVKVFGSYYTT